MNAVALGCVAALGMLLFGLGIAISLLRLRRDAMIGCPADPTDLLHKLVRAHGNTAEYAALIAVLILYLGAHQPAGWVLALMVAITACRYLLAAGLILSPTLARPHLLRFVGALGTYVCGVALCGALLVG